MKRPRSNRPARTLDLRSAREAVRAVLALHGITDEIRAQRLLTEWADLVGPKISSKTRPQGVSDRILTVEVASSAWVQELTMLKPQILAGLHERMGVPRLFDDLRFKLAGRSGPGRPQPPRPRAPLTQPPRAPVPPATGAAREKIAREVEAVDDLELRELIARVRISNDK